MDVRHILSGFVQGRVSRAELEGALAGSVRVEFDGPNRAVKQMGGLGVEVSVRPEDVRARLQAYLSSQITAETLSEWASLILLIDAFVWEGHGFQHSTPGERAWLVIQELSAPQVHGAITPASVQRKLESLVIGGRHRVPAV
jgi:hypothetical protein